MLPKYKKKFFFGDLYSTLGFICAKTGTAFSDLASMTLSFSFTVAGREAAGALWGGAFLVDFLTLTEGTAHRKTKAANSYFD